MVKCNESNTDAEGGCATHHGIWSYEDQLKRDYPSFSQIRKVIKQKSKYTIHAIDLIN